MRTYRYFDFVMAGFVTVLLCANLIGAGKATTISVPGLGPVTLTAAAFFFPVSYVFGDVLTEVYGYSKARKVIWAGFAAMLFAALMAALVVALPPAGRWPHQQAFETVFGTAWRIAAASLFAYFCGEFVNSFVLAKLKVWSAGRHQGARFVGSTLAGEAVDSALFYPIAFYNSGLIPNELLLTIMLTSFTAKTLVEIAFLPITYRIVAFLKRAENEDFYDRNTNFNPFRVEA